MIRRSPAKINWNLRVLQRRADGFHELESLVSPVTLYDELAFAPRAEAGVALRCDRPDVPLDDRNLIVRAGRELAAHSGMTRGASCELVKRIPMGGGLGGGSSNAATALLGLCALWGLTLSRQELAPLAAMLGSDVPLFLAESSVIMRGRGERVQPVTVDFAGWIVLLLPPLSVSTAAVYAALCPGDHDGCSVEPETGLDALGWMQRAFNSLEAPAMKVCPPLRPLLEQATALAGRPVRMSGSGSSLFTAFDDPAGAEAFAQDAERRMQLQSRIVQVIR